MNDDDPVVLIPGLGARVLGFVSPLLLFGVVGVGFARSGGLSPLGWFLALLGVVILLSALFDQPWRIELTPEGVLRRCLLRSRLYPWSDVVALNRLPRKRRRSDPVSRAIVGQQAPTDGSVGLLARVGTKRIMLMDRNERLDQWELMTTQVRRWSPGCSLPPKPATDY